MAGVRLRGIVSSAGRVAVMDLRRGPGQDQYLATRPGADVLYTSCSDGPGSPRAFYLRHGFVDTGRVMEGENILALELALRV